MFVESTRQTLIMNSIIPGLWLQAGFPGLGSVQSAGTLKFSVFIKAGSGRGKRRTKSLQTSSAFPRQFPQGV